MLKQIHNFILFNKMISTVGRHFKQIFVLYSIIQQVMNAQKQTKISSINDPFFGQMIMSQGPTFIKPNIASSLTEASSVISSNNNTKSLSQSNYSENSRKDTYTYGKTERKQSQTKDLTVDDIFYCNCQQDSKCFICNGQKTVTGEKNLTKFIAYILDFKLGNVGDYQPEQFDGKTKSTYLPSVSSPRRNRQSLKHIKIPELGGISVRDSLLRSSKIGQSQLFSGQTIAAQCQQKKFVHEQYKCDQCGKDPIKGSRFHCYKCADYDICLDCYQRNNHQHPLKEFKTSVMHNQMSRIVSYLAKSQKMVQSCKIDKTLLEDIREGSRSFNSHRKIHS